MRDLVFLGEVIAIIGFDETTLQLCPVMRIVKLKHRWKSGKHDLFS